MSRRTTLDVMADILRITTSPASKTKILYAANLSYSQAVKYVEILLACGMLSKVDGEEKDKFVITDSGQGFLTKISPRFGKIPEGNHSVWT